VTSYHGGFPTRAPPETPHSEEGRSDREKQARAETQGCPPKPLSVADPAGQFWTPGARLQFSRQSKARLTRTSAGCLGSPGGAPSDGGSVSAFFRPRSLQYNRHSMGCGPIEMTPHQIKAKQTKPKQTLPRHATEPQSERLFCGCGAASGATHVVANATALARMVRRRIPSRNASGCEAGSGRNKLAGVTVAVVRRFLATWWCRLPMAFVVRCSWESRQGAWPVGANVSTGSRKHQHACPCAPAPRC